MKKIKLFGACLLCLFLFTAFGACLNGESVNVADITDKPTVTESVETTPSVPDVNVKNDQGDIDVTAVSTPSPTPVPTSTATPTPDPRVILTFAGDVCLSENYFPYITYASQGYDISACISEGFVKEMKESDLCFVNSEFPFTTSTKKLGGKLYNFKADPSLVKMYQELGIDIAGLANNHVYDYGEQSLTDTMDTIKNAGISYVGAGRNITEAETPLYFDVKGIRVAYVMASKAEKNRKTPEATDSSAGILLCYDSERLVKALKEAQNNADYVILILHWGKENSSALESDQYDLAAKYIDAGADIVIGGHSHVIQGVDYYKGKPIFYSLGDFWFDYYTEDTFLLKLTLEKEADGNILSEASILPGVQKEGYTELQTNDFDRERIFKQLCKLSDSGIIDKDGTVYEKSVFGKTVDELYANSYEYDFNTDFTANYSKEYEIGAVVCFGNYYLNGSDKEKLPWYVIDKQGDEVTLLSKYILDEKAFDDENRHVKWENCSLRTWLNSDFYKAAFSKTEREQILADEVGDVVTVPTVSLVTGSFTLPKEYLMAAPSYYAFKKGIYTYNPITAVIKCTDWGSGGYSEFGFGCWWLKDNGPIQGTAAFVNEYGEAQATGMYTGYYSYSDGLCGVRPVIKLKVK